MENDIEAIGHPERDTHTVQNGFKCIQSFSIHVIGLQGNYLNFKQIFNHRVNLSTSPGQTVKKYTVCAPLK